MIDFAWVGFGVTLFATFAAIALFGMPTARPAKRSSLSRLHSALLRNRHFSAVRISPSDFSAVRGELDELHCVFIPSGDKGGFMYNGTTIESDPSVAPGHFFFA